MKSKCMVCWLMMILSPLLHAEVTESANILALFPWSSRSQNNVYGTLTRALAQRGHRLTVVTSQPMDSPPPNYKQIDVHEHVAKRFEAFNVTRRIGVLDTFKKLKEITVDVFGEVIERKEVKALANPEAGETFDLILITNFFGECFYPFARIHDAPIVLVSPGGPIPSTFSSVGNVMLPSFFAEPFLGYSDRMDFKQRLMNTLSFIAFKLLYKYYIQRTMEIEMRANFGEDTPSISELEEHVSLALLNNHFSLNQARQVVPSIVEVGGLHIKPPKELPKGRTTTLEKRSRRSKQHNAAEKSKDDIVQEVVIPRRCSTGVVICTTYLVQDLKSFLDGAGKEGAIYFSLGSFLKSSQLPKEKRDAFISVFSKVKQRVLWKWEDDNLIPGLSENVKLEKWLPQQDVLAHPNVKLFITHGGLLSFQEAANRGVPLVGIPHFGDQEMNMKRVLDLKVGLKLDSENLTSDIILGAINQVLGNPTYAVNMRRLQFIFTDQKDDPLERAVYWVEYVLRHGGAKHLKPAAFYLHWYQTYMLDVLLVLAVVPFLVTLLCAFLALKVAKKVCRSRHGAASAASEGKKTQ